MKENKLMAPGMAIDLIAQQDWLERTAGAVQPAVIRAFKAGGRAGRKIKNFLHSSWFGRPLHPALTDVPLGAWMVAFVFDVMAGKNGRKDYARASDAMVETCAHMGGPPAEGTLIDGTVRCPWRGSRYALEDGRALDGPSAFPQQEGASLCE